MLLFAFREDKCWSYVDISVSGSPVAVPGVRLLRVFQKSSVLTAEIVDAFVEKVTVDVDKHIFVEYSFKD